MVTRKGTGGDCDRNDFLCDRKKFLWFWGVPIVLIIAGSIIDNFASTVWIAGVLMTISTGWVGMGCFLNGRRCGRVHCKIDGILMPLLSVAGLLILFGILPVSWDVYFFIFWAVMLISYLPEWFWRKYV